MKRTLLNLSCWLACGLSALAAPLPKESLPADAKWLLHLDAGEFKNSQLGKSVAEKYIEPHWAEASAAMQAFLGITLNWQDLNGVTVFGTDTKPDDKAVVLVQLQKEARQKLQASIHEKAQGTNAVEMGLEEEEGSNGPIFIIGGGQFAAPQKDNLVLISKNRQALEKAMAVVNGKSPNLTKGNSFAGFSDDPKGIIFMALAEGFYGTDQLPPQAQIFKQAEGGKVVAGERADRLFLTVSLKAKTADACTQMQQVLQGFQALMALSKTDDPDITALLNSIKITTNDRIVSVSLDYPEQQALEKLAALTDKKAKHKKKKQPQQ